MSYIFYMRLTSGEIVRRHAPNLTDVPDVTDDGVTRYVAYDHDDFPVTPGMCNSARERRADFRRIYAAGGGHYPG
jgi:hypothetical protein